MKYNLKTLQQEQYLIPIRIVLLYAAWKAFHYFAMLPGTALSHFWTAFVYNVGCLYARATSMVLSIFGMKAVAAGININLIASCRQIWVQDHCLAIPATVIFIGSVLFFKGRMGDKLGFGLTGVVGIILINILRLIFICVAWVYMSADFFKLNHSVIYVVITYGFIFFMLAKWMDRTVQTTEKTA